VKLIAAAAGLIGLVSSMQAAVHAQTWCMDPANSWLGFTAAWEGREFEGRFKDFTARIEFLPQQPDLGMIEVMVSTASAGTGNRERDEGMADPEWFDFAAHPQAHYVASAFRAVDSTTFDAIGKLTLKGISRPVDVRFSWREVDGVVFMQGETELNRVDFGVGSGEWADEEFVAHAVKVAFHLELSSCAAQQ